MEGKNGYLFLTNDGSFEILQHFDSGFDRDFDADTFGKKIDNNHNIAKKNNIIMVSTDSLENEAIIPEKELQGILKLIVPEETCKYKGEMKDDETLEQFSNRFYDTCNYLEKDEETLKEFTVAIANCNLGPDGKLYKLNGKTVKIPCSYAEEEIEGQGE